MHDMLLTPLVKKQRTAQGCRYASAAKAACLLTTTRWSLSSSGLGSAVVPDVETGPVMSYLKIFSFLVAHTEIPEDHFASVVSC